MLNKDKRWQPCQISERMEERRPSLALSQSISQLHCKSLPILHILAEAQGWFSQILALRSLPICTGAACFLLTRRKLLSLIAWDTCWRQHLNRPHFLFGASDQV